MDVTPCFKRVMARCRCLLDSFFFLVSLLKWWAAGGRYLTIDICSAELCPLAIGIVLRRGHSFFSANEELLEIYSHCATAVEVISEQNRWLEGGPAGSLPRVLDTRDSDDEEGDEAGDEDYRRRMNRELPPTDSDEGSDQEEEEGDGEEKVKKADGHGGSVQVEEVRARLAEEGLHGGV